MTPIFPLFVQVPKTQAGEKNNFFSQVKFHSFAAAMSCKHLNSFLSNPANVASYAKIRRHLGWLWKFARSALSKIYYTYFMKVNICTPFQQKKPRII